MAFFNKFNLFTSDLAQKIHNLNSDTLKIMLSNVAPIVGNHVKADITEIAVGNGYTAGGAVASFVSGNSSSGLYRLILSPVVFTAVGGTFANFQFPILYNATAAQQNLIGWWDYGAPITLTAGNNFTVGIDQANGVLTLE